MADFPGVIVVDWWQQNGRIHFIERVFLELPASQPHDNSKNRSETPSTTSTTSIQKGSKPLDLLKFSVSQEKGEEQLKIFEYPSDKHVVVVATNETKETKEKKLLARHIHSIRFSRYHSTIMSTSNNNNNNHNNKNYGSTAQNPTSLNTTTALLSPSSPLLPSTTTTQTSSKKSSLLLDHLTQPLSPTSLSNLLLVFYFLTGILDSSAILTLGAFVSMQTGNTVYFGSGVILPLIGTQKGGNDGRGDNGDKWIRAGISVGSFCLGSWGFAKFHWFFGARKNKNKKNKNGKGEKEEIPKTRWLVLCSIFFQMGILGIAGVVVPSTTNIQVNQHHKQKQLPLDLNFPVILALILISLQSSGQAYLSRIFGYNSLTSVVLTSLYLDLFSDPHLFSHHHGEKFRRIAAVVCLLAGAMLGGCMVNFGLWGGLKGALWVAVGLKGVVGLGCWFWRGEVVVEEEGGEEGEG